MRETERQRDRASEGAASNLHILQRRVKPNILDREREREKERAREGERERG